MPLDPATANFLAQVQGLIPVPPPLDSQREIAAFLGQLSARPSNLLEGPPEPIAGVDDLVIDGPGGPIPARIYRPDGDSLPVIVFFHGGVFVLGDLEMHDPSLRYLANALPAVVLSADYRLAPTHPYPAAIDDCFAALKWAAEHVEQLGGDPRRLVVMGDSAGGALAAVAAVRARDDGGPALALQVLLYPMVDPKLDTASANEFAEGYMTTRALLEIGWSAYLGNDIDRPCASPAAVEDLTGLPAAIIVTAGYDPLRDEGLDYAHRMTCAGVEVTELHYAGQIHGFAFMPAAIPAARPALASLVERMRLALSPHDHANPA